MIPGGWGRVAGGWVWRAYSAGQTNLPGAGSDSMKPDRLKLSEDKLQNQPSIIC